MHRPERDDSHFSDPMERLVDPDRLRRVGASGMTGRRDDDALNRLIGLAARITGEGIAAFCVAGDHLLDFPSAHGLPEPMDVDREAPLHDSLSQYVVANDAPLVVSDAREHPVLRHNESVKRHGVAAYAGYPVHDPDGVVLGVLCLGEAEPRVWSAEQLATLSDLAALIETEIAFKMQTCRSHLIQERLQHVIDGVTGTAVLAADADGIVTVLNSVAERLLGTSAASVVGLESLTSVLRSAQPLGPKPRDGEAQDWLLVDGVGQTKVVSARARVLRDPSGNLGGFVILAEDVSDRRESGALLRESVRKRDEAVQRLTELEWARTVFIATAAHELRTPLSSILGYTELLVDGAAGELSPHQRELITRVEGSSKRMFSLVEDLLDLSRLDGGSATADHVRVDPNVPAQHAWDTLQPFLAQRGLQGNLELSPLSAHIRGDAAQVERALVNVLRNAVKFTPEGGAVRLTVRASAESIEYEVTDTGMGISEAERSSVGEPFFRTRLAHSGAIEGAGVGLSIVRRIAEAHGGQVRILPGQEIGTTVILALPVDRTAVVLPAVVSGPPTIWGAGEAQTQTSVSVAGGVEAELRAALDGTVEEFVLHYQPIVDLTSGKVVAVESLVRWQHPERGLLAPDQFIPVAEASGLVRTLGDWALAQALRDAVHLVHEGRELDVAVNVSARQFDDRIVAAVRLALKKAGVRPERLILEASESALIEDEDVTAAAYEGLSKLGVKIAVDDFGTGFTSLLHLRRHPIDCLKIDRRFVAGLGESAADEAMCRSILGLASAVGASTVGEGIETAAQYAALRSLGCRRGQGFLWSPAVPLAALGSALASSELVATPPARIPRAARFPAEVTSMIASMHAEGASMHTIAAALNRAVGHHPDGMRWTAAAVAQGLAAAVHAESAGGRVRVAVGAPTSESRRQ